MGRQWARSRRSLAVAKVLIAATLPPLFFPSASADEDFSLSVPGEDSPNTGLSLPALSSPCWDICGAASPHG